MKWKSLLSAVLAMACTLMLLSACGGETGTSVKSEQAPSTPAAVTEVAVEAPQESTAEVQSAAEED